MVKCCCRKSVTYEDGLFRGGGGGIDHVMNDDRYTRCGGVRERVAKCVVSILQLDDGILSSNHSPQEEEGRTTEDIERAGVNNSNNQLVVQRRSLPFLSTWPSAQDNAHHFLFSIDLHLKQPGLCCYCLS